MPLRGLAALLLLGGMIYAVLSGNWGIGAITFGLGAAMLGWTDYAGPKAVPSAP